MNKIKDALRNLIRYVLTPIVKNHIHTIKFGSVAITVKGGVGFLRVIHHLTPEERFLSNLDLKNKTIYDIGSHIGILAIFFAKTSGRDGRVIAFEPNPESYLKIRQNVELNGLDNVQIINIGIGDKRRTETMVVPRNISGWGSMEKNIQLHILKLRGAKSLKVEIDTLDKCIEANKLPKPDFIKMDIEGMEYNALIGMAETITKYKPSFHIEIHGVDKESKIKNIQRIVKYFDSHGYSISHVESEQMVPKNNAQIAKEGHIFCVYKTNN